ncbi:transcription factor [Aspergillus wentii]|nr:transcription factor [Aspergillus wentii]
MFGNSTQIPDDALIRRFRRDFAGVLDSNFHNAQAPVPLTAMETMTPFSGEFHGPQDPTASSFQDFGYPSSSIYDSGQSFMGTPHQPGFFTPGFDGLGGLPRAQINPIYPGAVSQSPQYFTSPFPGTLDHQNMNMGLENFYQPETYKNPQPWEQNTSHSPDLFTSNDYEGGWSPSDPDPRHPIASPVTALTPDSPPGSDGQSSDNESFRFTATLNAPTAMVKHENETPVTYLNKGQIYHLSVLDSAPTEQGTKYKTSVRIVFEDEELRSKTSSCWQLWRNSRGLREAGRRDGKLHALEYVDPAAERSKSWKYPLAPLEKASLDGFSVTWTADVAAGVSGCTVPLRCNFLSTDFSLSKGIKGAAVRLCAKTKIVTQDSAADSYEEVSYCKLKVFRDHGAERKISNDIAYVKRMIDKLDLQIADADAGTGKRKRAQPWSTDPQDRDIRNDPKAGLNSMHGMLSSARPVSLLSLRDDKGDDLAMFSSSSQSSDEQATMEKRPSTNEPESVPSVPSVPTDEKPEPHYRAIYLVERTVRDLVDKIAQKRLLNPASIVRVIHVRPSGMKILLDDEVLAQIPDGQDMLVEFVNVSDQAKSIANDTPAPAVEVRLQF